MKILLRACCLYGLLLPATLHAVETKSETETAAAAQLPEQLAVSRSLESSPYVLLPLRQNYVLPVTYNPEPNQEPYRQPGSDEDLMDQNEAKLQISLKFPLSFSDLLAHDDGIYFGFTLKSFWQVYNSQLSAPFRETNYRPEIFYEVPLKIGGGDGAWIGRLGLEHESNGRTQLLSRSWNRSYLMLGYTEENWMVALQPWYRLPEDPKVDDGDPDTPPPPTGDDNPNIDDYMGNFELTGAYRWKALEFSGLFRRNFAEGHGAMEVGMSFPLWGRLRGYAQYFEGYGESMIDYDYRNRRIGLGFLFTDVLAAPGP